MTQRSQAQRYCDGMPRREFIQTGLAAMGGFGMADLLRIDCPVGMDT